MRRAAFLMLAVAVALALVPSCLQSEELLFHRDLLDFFLPMKASFARAGGAGHVPWWDPWTEGGQPFFATLQSQVLYPPNLVFLAVRPLQWALSLFVAMHLAWAGLGAAALAGELGASRISAALALVLVEAGGFLVSLVDLLNQACAQAWLPWIAWGACRFAKSGSRRDLAAWSAALAFAFLAGEPQYAALGGVASLALGWSVAREARIASATRRCLAGAAAAALLALAACAVQAGPFAELVLRSTRMAGPASEAGRHALEPGALAALVVAPRGPFGGPAGHFVESLHLGIAGLALALAGAALRRAPARMLVLLSLASIALALGPHLPVLGRLHVAATPFLRYPIKDFCVAAVGLPLLAALGLDELRRRLGSRRLSAALATGLLVAASAEVIRAQRRLLPTLPARPLLATTPLIDHLRSEASPDGPRAHATPLTTIRLERRAARVASGDLAGAMRERVELLEGALPMLFEVPATWGGTALPEREHAALLEASMGPLQASQVRDLRAGWLVDSAERSLPLERVPVEGGAAVLYRLEGFDPPPRRQWRGPNVAVGSPGLPPPSDWPGWREIRPGTWRFRPTGLVPLATVSILGWGTLVALALAGARRRTRSDDARKRPLN